MPFNGAGTFNRIYSWTVDAANNVNISSSRMDAELNGMAAALSNCVTRDGQSPPSADLPMGGKKLTNLGNATTSTDAVNLATGDARYLLLSGGTVTGNVIFSGLVTVNNNVSAQRLDLSDVLSVGTNNKGLYFKDASGSTPYFICQNDNNFVFYGTDASGVARSIWSVAMRNSTSVVAFSGTPTAPTATAGDNSTKLATTAFIVASYAPLASPTFTGTPAAPTAAAGTATTQIATTGFADRLRDLPQNLQTGNYTLALTDRGGSVDFNGTGLTCTVPANASVAFPVGTVILVSNFNASPLTITCADTMFISGTTTTGTRTLAQNGEARLRKTSGTGWIISGTGMS